MNPDFLKQWNKSDELICWIKKARNQDIFARAWVDGYEVEKEPRYTVRVKGINGSHQWMRITEEVGEIRDVLLKPTKFTEPQAALKDAIGDTLVTIIVLAYQLDLDVAECLSIAYEEIKNRKGKMVNGTFVKEEDL